MLRTPKPAHNMPPKDVIPVAEACCSCRLSSHALLTPSGSSSLHNTFEWPFMVAWVWTPEPTLEQSQPGVVALARM